MSVLIVPFAVGVLLAGIIALSAHVTRFDRDRSFYPTLLIVIASYYVLFAIVANQSIALELAIAATFAAIAIVGAKKRPTWIGVGLIVHGLFDFSHPTSISNPGVPPWWPSFCAGVDVALGAWVIYLTKQKEIPT